jgi:pimeloyl-ACP methyl ester carboxylesterase
MRGYNLSAKPHGVRAYRLPELARDVVGLVRHARAERALIVGHDWGGLVAWWVAMFHPEVVERLVVLNAPHPAVFPARLLRGSQLRKSRYMFWFQLPRLAERGVAAGDYAVLRRSMRRDPVRRGAFSEEDIERYVLAIGRPGALTAALNYYRAAFRAAPFLALRARRRSGAPVLLIWGEQDRYLEAHLLEGTGAWAPDLRIERIAEASHWVQADAPERVNGLLIDFARGGA